MLPAQTCSLNSSRSFPWSRYSESLGSATCSGRCAFLDSGWVWPGVLFTGLAAGALGPGVAPPSIVSSVGLILFIHSIGIQFGPGFVNPFRSEG